VGILYRSTANRSPRGMGCVPHCILWSPLDSGHCAPQACRVSRAASGEPFCVWYTHEFNNLAQNSGHDVHSDAKKAELYCKGLNIQLQDYLI
jgi:hypothetical protein